MQKERTLQFWDEFHEANREKEWLVHGNSTLFETILDNCHSFAKYHLRVLEIGCGTSNLSRDFWHCIQDSNQQNSFRDRVLVRATDVSRVCVDSCYERDKKMPHVFGPGDKATDSNGIEYGVLDVQVSPTDKEAGLWDVIIDKACMDTFLFRSKSRGEGKNYPSIVRVALLNIWRLLADTGVYILISPRSKLKAVRDFAGFESVERRDIRPETSGVIVSKVTDLAQVCYLYICHKNKDFNLDDPNPFRQDTLEFPSDDTICNGCNISFYAFREGEVLYGRGKAFWKRKWTNHCSHCKRR